MQIEKLVTTVFLCSGKTLILAQRLCQYSTGRVMRKKRRGFEGGRDEGGEEGVSVV